jgi:hypothetical protein
MAVMCGATARCCRGHDPCSPRSYREEDHARQAEAECLALWTQGLETAETARGLPHTADGHALKEGDFERWIMSQRRRHLTRKQDLIRSVTRELRRILRQPDVALANAVLLTTADLDLLLQALLQQPALKRRDAR